MVFFGALMKESQGENWKETLMGTMLTLCLLVCNVVLAYHSFTSLSLFSMLMDNVFIRCLLASLPASGLQTSKRLSWLCGP